MAILLTYYPNKGVSLNNNMLLWGLDRSMVRRLLGDSHKENDRYIDLSHYKNGRSDFNLDQRQDIYNNYQRQNNYFCFKYDGNNLLKEVELHHGIDIQIQDIRLRFEMDFREAVSLLTSISADKSQSSDGEYTFSDLKLTIANGEAMGAEEEDVLSYFYCVK